MMPEPSEEDRTPIAAVRWFHCFLQTEIARLPPEELARWVEWSSDPPNLEKFRRVKQTWQTLGPVLTQAQRPSEAEIAADEYDGSQSIERWLAQSRPSGC